MFGMLPLSWIPGFNSYSFFYTGSYNKTQLLLQNITASIETMNMHMRILTTLYETYKQIYLIIGTLYTHVFWCNALIEIRLCCTTNHESVKVNNNECILIEYETSTKELTISLELNFKTFILFFPLKYLKIIENCYNFVWNSSIPIFPIFLNWNRTQKFCFVSTSFIICILPRILFGFNIKSDSKWWLFYPTH